MTISTLSVLLHDPVKKEWGVAVQSFYLAVGSLVVGTRAGAGAIVTQGIANPAAIEPALRDLESGKPASEVLPSLLGDDRDIRQFGIIDGNGTTAAHTGSRCPDEAGSVAGANWLAIGNTAAPGAIEAMGAAIQSSEGKPSIERLHQALAAGMRAGGDRRGRLSAALRIVRHGGGYLGQGDVVADLRVDADRDPIAKLRELIDWHRLYHPEPESAEMVALSQLAPADKARLRSILGRWLKEGAPEGDDGLIAALADFNVGARIDPASRRIDVRLIQDMAFLSP